MKSKTVQSEAPPAVAVQRVVRPRVACSICGKTVSSIKSKTPGQVRIGSHRGENKILCEGYLKPVSAPQRAEVNEILGNWMVRDFMLKRMLCLCPNYLDAYMIAGLINVRS